MAELATRVALQKGIERQLSSVMAPDILTEPHTLLHAKSTLLDNYWQQFLDAHLVCAATAVTDEAMAVQDTYLSGVESKYLTTRAKLDELMAQVPKSGGQSQGEPKVRETSTQGIALEEIKIGKFDGQYHLWRQFRDTFISMVHSKSCFQDIQKFHYLMDCLTGEAAQVVRGTKSPTQITVTPGGNYWNVMTTII